MLPISSWFLIPLQHPNVFWIQNIKIYNIFGHSAPTLRKGRVYLWTISWLTSNFKKTVCPRNYLDVALISKYLSFLQSFSVHVWFFYVIVLFFSLWWSLCTFVENTEEDNKWRLAHIKSDWKGKALPRDFCVKYLRNWY